MVSKTLHTKKGRSGFPGREWSTVHPGEVETAERKAFEQYLFGHRGDERERAGIRTDGVVVIQKGQLVYEKYDGGFGPSVRHQTWSVAKSVVNALVGIAVRKGRLQLDEPVSRYLSGYRTPSHQGITIQQTLQMSSGIEWFEGYEATPLRSDVVTMLYGDGHRDMAAYTAGRPTSHAAGTFWYYSSGETNVLSAVLKEAMGDRLYRDLPWKELFEPLGMSSAVFETDEAGAFVGSSYLFVTPRDLARFGYLYLNDGVWNGQRILPEGWVEFSTTLPTSFYSTPLRQELREYNPGAHWFINTGDPSRSLQRPWPSAPDDVFVGSGHWGQLLVVIPSQDLVAVRLADDRDGSFEKDRFLGLLSAAFPAR